MADLSQYDDIFKAAGDEWNVDPTLLKAVATQESGGNTRAVSSKGAQGLMQITPDTQKYLGMTDPNDPVQSIYGAAKYLNEGLNKEGTPEGALLYYHGGPGWRQAYGPESRAYVPAVTAHYVALQPQQADRQPQAAPVASAPAPAPSSTSQSGPLILGDSLASKDGLGGQGVVGASPAAIRDTIKNMPAEQVQGRDVVLSGGASNNPAQASLVYDQVQQLKAKGANSVTVVGVGDRPDFQGVNDQLALVSGRSGANFVPLDTTQLSGDRVHPTAQGYKTLLAAVTPKTATDASTAPAPAPAAPQGQGKAMASDDLPSWLPPAPSAGGAASAPAATAGATSDGLPSWLPPAPQSTTKTAPPAPAQPTPTVDEYGRVITPMGQVPDSPALDRIREAAGEGWEGVPSLPRVPSDLVTSPIYNPLIAAAETGLRAGGALLRGGQQVVVEATPNISLPSLPPGVTIPLGGGRQLSGELTPGSLGREIAALPEAFPTGTNALRPPERPPIPEAPSSPLSPRFVGEYYGEAGPGTSLQRITSAIQAADEAAKSPPGLPPVPDGMVRLYHGHADTVDPTSGGDRWVTPDYRYARDWTEGGKVSYVDVPRNDPAVAAATDNVNLNPDGTGRVVNFNAPERIAGQMQPVPKQPTLAERQAAREAAPAGPTTPQPTGAQVSSAYEAIHTPAEEAAYRGRAEGQKLLEPQIIGEPDLNQYIPGETANNAEREQTVKAARELKELGIRVPEASQMDKAAAESNNTARTIYLDNTTKGPVEINNRRVQRQNDIEADKQTVFASDNVTGPVDLKPVISGMEKVLNQPFNRQNTALQQAYRPWLDRLKAFDGGKIDNPEEAWGLRYDIDQQTDKFAQRDNPNMHRVAHQLAAAADAIDTQIEKVAPGYADMLARYKDHSRAIDEMEVLQGAKDKFRGPGQKLTYNDFQRYMKNVVDSRMTPSTDLNPYKAISDENMQRLWNIRDSLRRTASAQELAKAAGSDTMPNIIDALKAVGKMGGTAALHAYVGSHLGPGGNLALQSLGAIGKSLNDRRMIRRATTQMNRLLRPDEPLRVPPGQENLLSGGSAP